MDTEADVEDLLAEVEAEIASEYSDVEVESGTEGGPEVELDDDLGTENDDVQADEGELPTDGDESDYDEEGEEESEEEPEGEPEEEPEPEAPSEDKGQSARIESLEHELRLMRQERDQARQPRQPPPESPRIPAPDPQLTEAVKLAFFGGQRGREALANYSPEIQRKAAELARAENEAVVLKTVDPDAYYHKYLAPIVDAHITARTRQFSEAQRRSEEDLAVDPHRPYLNQGENLKAVGAVMRQLPGGGTFKERLDLAVELNKGRSGGTERAKQTQREKSRERDRSTNKGSRKRRTGRGRRRSGGRAKAPEVHVDDVMGDVAYLQEQERQGLL